jgi:hypothetical protein
VVGAIAVAAVLFGSFVTGGMALAQETAGAPGSAFEGLWKGVDRADGSELQVSIVHNAGEYEILLRDSFFSLCLMEGFTSGRGMDIGVGTLVDRNLLEFEFTLFCFSDADPATPVPVNVTSVDLSLRSRGEVLVLGFDPEIFLHRVGN